MARIIFTSRYLKRVSKQQAENMVNYYATRDGAEKIISNKLHSSKQKDFIEREVTAKPFLKDSFEYEDYEANPTAANASELITRIAEHSLESEGNLENYIDYLAHRPRAEREESGHALWSAFGEGVDLAEVINEVSNHKGNKWTHVVSLTRADAERLGYDNANAWQSLVKSKLPIISENMGTPLADLKCYGAFHNEAHHPHIHLLVYSRNPKKGFLKNAGIEKMRSSFATAIFKNDLLHVYEQKDILRKQLNELSAEKMKQLTKQIESRNTANPIIVALMERLSTELKKVKGKTDYGWLKGVPKNLVDEIMLELSKDSDIAAMYRLWCDMKDETLKTYMKKPPKHTALADEIEFRKIKNMVIHCAKNIDAFIPQKEPALEKKRSDTFDAPDSDKYIDIEVESGGDTELPESLKQPTQTHSPVSATLNLIRNLSKLIAEDYEQQNKNYNIQTDKKLIR